MVARAHWDVLLFLSQLPSQILLARGRPAHGSFIHLTHMQMGRDFSLAPGEGQLRILGICSGH
jgi:hypothetical protein